MSSQPCSKISPLACAPSTTSEIGAKGSDMKGESRAIRSARVAFPRTLSAQDHVRVVHRPLTESSSSKTFTIGKGRGACTGGEPYIAKSHKISLRPRHGLAAQSRHIPRTASPAQPLQPAPGRRGSSSSPASRTRLLRARAGRRTASSHWNLCSAGARSGAARDEAGRRRHTAACPHLARMRGRRAGRVSVAHAGRATAGCRAFAMICRFRVRRRSRAAAGREHQCGNFMETDIQTTTSNWLVCPSPYLAGRTAPITCRNATGARRQYRDTRT